MFFLLVVSLATAQEAPPDTDECTPTEHLEARIDETEAVLDAELEKVAALLAALQAATDIVAPLTIVVIGEVEHSDQVVAQAVDTDTDVFMGPPVDAEVVPD